MKQNTMSVKKFTKKYMMEIILICMIILLAIFAEGFFSVNNLLSIFRNMAIVGVIAFGMTMVIIGGEIDLSVGSSIALSAVLTALISNNLAAGGMSPDLALVLSIIIALVIGIGIGAFNGFIRTKFNIPTFIITLAMLNVLYGIAAVISNGFPVTITTSWYSFIGAGQLFAGNGFSGIPVPAIWLSRFPPY